MRIAAGTVVSGRIILNDSEFLDATAVVIVSRDQDDRVNLSSEERVELEAGLAEIDRNETISGDALFARLRQHG